uniref:Pectinesterase inhibitor domain-containing protein n=2 Tax=Aegilops tauschii subsp. strangulata TaxID=200361 RepID=A0A453QDB2_AEGTS
QYTPFSVYLSPLISHISQHFSTSRFLAIPVVIATMPRTTIIFSTILFMLLSVVITAQSSSSDSGKPKATKLMVEACKNASINYPYGDPFSQEFCLSTLQSDNQSAEAKDLRALVLVAIDTLKSHVTAAGGKIKKMLQDAKKGTVMMPVLSFCEVDYDHVVRRLNVCQGLIRDYQGDKSGRQPLRLTHCVEMSFTPLNKCSIGLEDMPGVEVLSKENVELQFMVQVNTGLLASYDVHD